MAKILTKFSNATIVDAFSGPGVYTYGQLGSPIVTAKAYLNHSRRAKFGRLSILCCEERTDRVERLRKEIAKLAIPRTMIIELMEPGTFNERLAELRARSHGTDRKAPVLWLIDPFDIASVSMDNLAECLASPRDEVIVTFFVDEMYRFAGKNPNMAPALDRQFGSEVWHAALSGSKERERKEAFTKIFRDALEQRCGVLTSSFGIAVKNASSRYDLVFATHNDKGLECWNGMAWRIDTITGRRTSASLAEEPDLFGTSDTSELECKILELAGREVTWSDLVALTGRAQFKEKHLRQALSALNDRGLVFRTSPLESTTPWPIGSTVQVHSPTEFGGSH